MAQPRGITIAPTDYPFPTRHEVIAAIRDAFSGVDREDAISLREADVIDSYGNEDERTAARLLDTDQIWEQVPEVVIDRYRFAITFLDPKGFRYYIPAFMVRGLELPQPNDAKSGAIFHLSRLDNEFYYRKHLELLNDSQRKAIALFLLYFTTDYLDGDHARDALHRFWNDYLPEQYREKINDV